MATYSSKPTVVKASANDVFAKLSNPGRLKEMLAAAPADRLAPEQREMLEKMEITDDAIVIPGGPMGSITLRVVERQEPSLIKMQAEGSPVPLFVEMVIKPLSDNECEAKVQIDIEIPVMLKPMVSGPLQKLADQMGDLLLQLS